MGRCLITGGATTVTHSEIIYQLLNIVNSLYDNNINVVFSTD